MKKLIPIVFALGLLGLLIQLFVQSFIKYHETDYSIITNDNSYMINEKLNIEDDKHIYSFKVEDEKSKKIYQFNFTHNYNKQDSIIKDIKYFNQDGLVCIFPIYKKGYNGDIVCNYDDVQVSSSYLRQIGNKNIEQIISKLKEKKYKAKSWNDSSNFEKVDNYKIYKDNIPDSIIFTMWFYHGFYRIDNKGIEEKNYLNDDCYENNYSYLVNNFLVTLDTDETGTGYYTDFYIHDVVNGGKRKVYLDEQLSTNMYFNGVHNNKLYYTDLDNKTQYSLEPKNEIIKEVGNDKEGFKVLKGKELITIPAKDFLEEKVYFEKEIKNSQLEKLYGAKEIRKDEKMYYFLSENGNFYKAPVTDIKHPILLFNFKDVSEWDVKDDNLMVVSKDMLYFYNDEVGLLPILQNNELNYNYKNICNFIIK